LSDFKYCHVLLLMKFFLSTSINITPKQMADGISSF